MNQQSSQAARLISAVTIFANAALLVVTILLLSLDSISGAHEGHAVGLVMLGIYAYGFALFCMVVGGGYFIFKSFFSDQPAQGWQWLVLAWSFIQLAIPPLYFLS